MNVAIEMRFEVLKLAIKLATDTQSDPCTIYRSLISALSESPEDTTKFMAEQANIMDSQTKILVGE